MSSWIDYAGRFKLPSIDLILFYLPFVLIVVSVIWVFITAVLSNIKSEALLLAFLAMAGSIITFIVIFIIHIKPTLTTYSIDSDLIIDSDGIVDIYSENDKKSNFVVFGRERLSHAMLPIISRYIDAGKVVIPKETNRDQEEFDSAINFFMFNSMFGQWHESIPDWEMKIERYPGGQRVSYNANQDGAGRNTFLLLSVIDSLLDNKTSGFSLTESKFGLADGITLPPKTRIKRIDDAVVQMENKHIKISFTVKCGLGIVGFPSWKNGSRSVSRLVDRESYVYNKTVRLVIDVENKRERAFSLQREKYDEWLDQLIDCLECGLATRPKTTDRAYNS